MIYKNFSADKYRDSWAVVDLATSILILNNINLVFMVINAKKAGLNIIIIGVKKLDLNEKCKRLYYLYKIV